MIKYLILLAIVSGIANIFVWSKIAYDHFNEPPFTNQDINCITKEVTPTYWRLHNSCA